jgi:hypothetical protein
VSRSRHPAQRHLTVVTDHVATSEWWEAERAIAARNRAVTRLCHTAAWCLVAVTAVACLVILVDGYRGLR